MSVPIPNQETPGACAPAICAACGGEFGCGANQNCDTAPLDCWCMSVDLSPAALNELQERYRGCLCSKCLRAFAEKASTPLDGISVSAPDGDMTFVK